MFTTRPELVGTHGMVASTHWLASSAGMAVLESGGNAFDAAVAAGLTLQVVEPHLNGPGGEVPIIFHSAERAETLVIGGQGPAPAAASIAHFEELGLDLVPGTGLLAACVPGAFDAWMVLLGQFATSTRVMDTSGRRHGGLLSGDDLAAYRAELEGPATLDYHGYKVCKTRPWGQGPVFLQQLALLAGFDLADMGHNTPEYIHTVVECAKLAFADREAYYGDPRFVDVPLNGLLDPSYAETRRALVGEDASYELRPGTIGGRFPRLPQPPAAVTGGSAPGRGAPPGRRDPGGGGPP